MRTSGRTGGWVWLFFVLTTCIARRIKSDHEQYRKCRYFPKNITSSGSDGEHHSAPFLKFHNDNSRDDSKNAVTLKPDFNILIFSTTRSSRDFYLILAAGLVMMTDSGKNFKIRFFLSRDAVSERPTEVDFANLLPQRLNRRSTELVQFEAMTEPDCVYETDSPTWSFKECERLYSHAEAYIIVSSPGINLILTDLGGLPGLWAAQLLKVSSVVYVGEDKAVIAQQVFFERARCKHTPWLERIRSAWRLRKHNLLLFASVLTVWNEILLEPVRTVSDLWRVGSSSFITADDSMDFEHPELVRIPGVILPPCIALLNKPIDIDGYPLIVWRPRFSNDEQLLIVTRAFLQAMNIARESLRNFQHAYDFEFDEDKWEGPFDFRVLIAGENESKLPDLPDFVLTGLSFTEISVNHGTAVKLVFQNCNSLQMDEGDLVSKQVEQLVPAERVCVDNNWSASNIARYTLQALRQAQISSDTTAPVTADDGLDSLVKYIEILALQSKGESVREERWSETINYFDTPTTDDERFHLIHAVAFAILLANLLYFTVARESRSFNAWRNRRLVRSIAELSIFDRVLDEYLVRLPQLDQLYVDIATRLSQASEHMASMPQKNAMSEIHGSDPGTRKRRMLAKKKH